MSKTAVANRDRAKPKRNQVRKLIGRIDELLACQEASRAEIVRCHLELGECFLKLKEQVGHGRWIKTLRERGLHERSVEVRMRLAQSPLANEMRNTDSNLVHWLPSDLQKLAALAQLSVEQLHQAREANWDCHGMTRGQVRRAVQAILWGEERTVNDTAEEPRSQPTGAHSAAAWEEERPSTVDGVARSAPQRPEPAGPDVGAQTQTEGEGPVIPEGRAAFDMALEICGQLTPELVERASEAVAAGDISENVLAQGLRTMAETRTALRRIEVSWERNE